MPRRFAPHGFRASAELRDAIAGEFLERELPGASQPAFRKVARKEASIAMRAVRPRLCSGR